MEIVQERLERHSGLDIVQTSPTVTYEVVTSNGDVKRLSNPAELPDPALITEIREPWSSSGSSCPPTRSARC
jgi:GTP-binding protein LepA